METINRFFKTFIPSFFYEEIFKLSSNNAFMQSVCLFIVLSIINCVLFSANLKVEDLKLDSINSFPEFKIVEGKLKTSFERPKVIQLAKEDSDKEFWLVLLEGKDRTVPDEVTSGEAYVLLNDEQIEVYRPGRDSRAFELTVMNQIFGDPIIVNNSNVQKWLVDFLKIIKIVVLVFIPIGLLFSIPITLLIGSTLVFFLKLILNWKVTYSKIFLYSAFAATPALVTKNLVSGFMPKLAVPLFFLEWLLFIGILGYVASKAADTTIAEAPSPSQEADK